MAVDLTDRSWLFELCDEDRPTIAAPGTVLVGDRPHVCVTNGHALLLIAGETAVPLHLNAVHISGLVAALPAADVRFQLADLRAFLGPYASPTVAPCGACKGTRLVRCQQCYGSGDSDCSCTCGNTHEAECEPCGGSGKVTCDCQGLAETWLDPFLLGGIAFNRPLVARYIRHLPDGEVLAALVPIVCGRGQASALHGDGWTLLIMPLRTVREGSPAFPLPQAEAVA